MPTRVLSHYLSPFVNRHPPLDHIHTIRLGTKSLSFWPHRFISDPDSKALLDLFSSIIKSSRHLTVQAHFSHPRELLTPAVHEAIRLIRMTGANIRCQNPLIRHVNDSADTFRDMWTTQVALGLIPYYMFVERDTGASQYFSVPLVDAYQIFADAYSGLAGTARTVRGPSMSASPGKVVVVGIETISNEKVFVLKFLQARDPSWVKRVFFARFDPQARWISDLVPAFGEKRFFFEDEYQRILARVEEGSSGQLDL